MKNATKVVGAIIGLLTFVVQLDSVQHALIGFVTTHPAVALALTGISGLLALIHDPKAKDEGTKISRNVVQRIIVFFALLTFSAAFAHAQSTTQAPVAPAPTTQLQNIYGGGASWNQTAKPPVAITGLYAHRLSDNTYGFTIVDALTNGVKPFNFTTNIGVGVAQKIVTIGRLPIFIPTDAGVSFNGQNLGWSWSGGAATLIPLKRDNLYIMPTVRFLKSSVTGTIGYQPIFGAELCWGK